MLELDYLAADVPTLIVWSEHDPIIPVTHAYATHAHLPGSRLEIIPGRSHEPHRRPLPPLRRRRHGFHRGDLTADSSHS